MPRLTQSKIHSDFSTASATWSEYRAQVIAFYDNHPHRELNDHITREFNKKIRDLGQPESLYISPYNAGLRYIGDGIFTVDPLSFNPYFYIDAASSMLGVLESPSLDLNPAVSSTLDIITATRAGTATYTDASGNIQTASPNTVRVDHVGGVPMILVEPAATNLVTNTDFSDWIRASSTTLIDGSGYAGQPSKIFTASAGTHRTFRTPAFATTAGTTYTGSFWIRRVSGTGDIQLYHQYSAQGNLTNITSDISGEWTRVEKTFTGNASSGDVWFGIWINVQGDAVEIAMPQVETGTVATSFIPTSGSAVTRAADDLVIDGSDFANFYNQTEGTVYVETVGREVDFNYIYSISDGSSSNRILAIHAAFNHLYVQTSGVLQGAPDAGTFTAGTLCRYAASFKENDLSVTIDGGNVVTDTSATLPTVNKLNIGSRENGNEQLNGHIKRLIYWPHHSDNI